MIPLRAEFVDRLVRLRRVQVEALRHESVSTDRIFLTPTGEVWPKASRSAMRFLERVLDAAGIERVDRGRQDINVSALTDEALVAGLTLYAEGGAHADV